MNLLFIHGNFPGQFANIAPAMASRIAGAKVVFLTNVENHQQIELPGVTNVRFSLHRNSAESTHHYLKPMEETVLKGQAVVRALNGLLEEGFTPDVVVCHGGNGFGLYIKALLPQVKIISYMEWYFTRENSRYLFADFDINDILRLETRNAPLLQEMIQADEIVCPTEWQTRQFPIEFRSRITTIFDGVNPEFFCPKLPQIPLSLKSEISTKPLEFGSEQLLLTYGTRGMESLRGFPEFMRAAAAAQQEFSTLQVIIFGRDRSAYSYESENFQGSWKDSMLAELAGQLDISRTHFTGLLNYGDLVRLFNRSDLHCYFTRPYVVSWGVFQAAACGANLLVNNFPGMDEVFQPGHRLQPVDLDDQDAINRAVIDHLSKRNCNRKKLMQIVPESSLNPKLVLDQSLLQWEALIQRVH